MVRREGTDVALLAYGTATNDALKAADMLARSGVSATVVDMRCVGLRRILRKPFSMHRAHTQVLPLMLGHCLLKHEALTSSICLRLETSVWTSVPQS